MIIRIFNFVNMAYERDLFAECDSVEIINDPDGFTVEAVSRSETEKKLIRCTLGNFKEICNVSYNLPENETCDLFVKGFVMKNSAPPVSETRSADDGRLPP